MTIRLAVSDFFESGMKAAQIANELGITRQRVYQIIGKVGRCPPKVLMCGRCGKEFQRKPGVSTICEACHLLKMKQDLICPTCGIGFTLHRSAIRNRMKYRKKRGSMTGIFCSSRCSMIGNARARKEVPN